MDVTGSNPVDAQKSFASFQFFWGVLKVIILCDTSYEFRFEGVKSEF